MRLDLERAQHRTLKRYELLRTVLIALIIATFALVLTTMLVLLATAAVHHHLIREGTRTQCGLVIETAEAREVHYWLHYTDLPGEARKLPLFPAAAAAFAPSDRLATCGAATTLPPSARSVRRGKRPGASGSASWPPQRRRRCRSG